MITCLWKKEEEHNVGYTVTVDKIRYTTNVYETFQMAKSDLD
jgi:hypothetical protein